MIYEQDAVRRLYKRLLVFYPRTFREQLAESMAQTFNDLCAEKRRTKSGVFGFVLWIFIETAIGILREHLLLIKEGTSMQTLLTYLRAPAIISLLLVLPLMLLEWVNRRTFNEGFPFPLFAIMWILPMLFLLTGMPIVRNIRAGNSLLANPIILLIRVVFMAFLLWMWSGILIDQMPCFLGVPNCD